MACAQRTREVLHLLLLPYKDDDFFEFLAFRLLPYRPIA
jgi:hypothetical protein